MTERLGLFGGSFSPPHAGHLWAARQFCLATRPDRLLVVPAAHSPGKCTVDMPAPEHRLHMCRLAFDGLACAQVSDMEIVRGGESYTADTLRALSRPGREICVLVGTDAALALTRWREPETLFRLARFYTVSRETDPAWAEALARQNEVYRTAYGAVVTPIPAPPHPASSTAIREALARGERPADLDPRVFDYIRERGLYL